MSAKAPIDRLRHGNIQVSVFENSVERGGEEVLMPKFVIQNSYLDNSDKWQTTNSHSIYDLLKLKAVIDTCIAKYGVVSEAE